MRGFSAVWVALCPRLSLLGLFLLAGCGTPSFLVTPVENASELKEETVVKGGFAARKIAVIDVEGMLANVKSGGFMQPQENPLSKFVQELDKAAADSSVRAVVLRVNSPGGTVTTSDTMYDLLLRFKANTHKPVVASTQEVAASGAYYLCCASDKIVANPTSIVGSIGVIFETFDATGTMAKIGLRSEAIKSADLKDMGSPFTHVTPEARAVMQAMVDQYFARFKNVVATNRPISHDPVAFATLTDGRVFTGEDAVKLGLADQTGRLEDAIELAKRMSKSPNASVVLYKRPYGYSGSIYADTQLPNPQASGGGNAMELKLPGEASVLPGGFYYLWQP